MIELLQERLQSYKLVDSAEQEQALKQILQELILYAVWRQDFFEQTAFQGGTCLRILIRDDSIARYDVKTAWLSAP